MISFFARIRLWYRELSELNRRRLIAATVLGLLLAAACLILNNSDAPWEGDAQKYKESFDKGNRIRLPTEYFVQVYSWSALAVNTGILAALLLSSPLWVGWLSTGTPCANASPSRRGWLILGIGLLVGLSVRLPMMERSLLFDEQDNLRRSFHGYVDISKKGEKWIGASWQDTFFENRQGNNPPLYGVLARACVDTWRAVTGGEKDTFNLWMLRLPSLLAGLLTMFVIWRFLQSLGMPVAAAIATFLFALHPLAADYNTQARGYGLMLLFAVLSVHFVWHAIRSGSLKMWIAFALSQACMIWSYPGSLYLPLALNSALGVYFLLRWWRNSDRTGITKYVLANVLSLMLILQAMLPVLVQTKIYLDKKFAKSPLRIEWAFMAWHTSFAGRHVPEVSWWNSHPDGERDLAAYIKEDYLKEKKLLGLITLILSPALVILGVRRLRKKDGIASLLITAALISPILTFIHHKFITGLWVYYWYIIFVLPFLCMAIAIGLASIRIRKFPAATVVIAAVFLTLFAIAVESPKPTIPGSVYKSRPEVDIIKRPGYLFRITKEGRMTREKDK